MTAGTGATSPGAGPTPPDDAVTPAGDGRASTPAAASSARGWDLSARCIAGGARVFVRLFALGRIRVEGLDGLRDDPRMQGPLIVVANHISNLDPPLVGGWIAPGLRRRPAILAKEQLFRGVLGRIMRSQGIIPVRTGRSDIDAFRAARTVLDGGGAILIFPEGTRRADGVVGHALPGAAMLAARPGTWVLPVGVVDTDRLLRRGERLPRIGTPIGLQVGAPFQLVLDPGLPRRAALDAASEQLMGHIAALLPERHQGRFATPATPAEGA